MRCRAASVVVVVVVVSLLVVACTDFGTGQTTRHDTTVYLLVRSSFRQWIGVAITTIQVSSLLFFSLESNRPMERWTIGPPDIRLLNQKAGAAPPPPHQQERTHSHPSIHPSLNREERRGQRKLDSTRLNDVILSRLVSTRLSTSVCPVTDDVQLQSYPAHTRAPNDDDDDDDDNDDKEWRRAGR